MTQQPYYPQQPVPAPQPPQPYAQPAYPQPVPQQPAPQAYPQPYPQQWAQPAAPPVQLADGSIDAFYSQPNVGGGPGISWKGKPDGYTVQGVVARDVGDGDVQQEVGAPGSADAGRPLTFRDGRPKFVMAVPLHVPASPEFPEGEARLYVRGQLKDELTRAMAEAQVPEAAPKAGAVITVTLVQRKPGRGTIPQNIFAVTYTPAGQAPPPIQAAAQPTYAQPAQPQYQQPVYQQPAPAAPPAAPQATQAPVAASPASEAPAQPAVPQQAPVAQAPAAPAPPPGLTPEQQQLLAQMQQNQA